MGRSGSEASIRTSDALVARIVSSIPMVSPNLARICASRPVRPGTENSFAGAITTGAIPSLTAPGSGAAGRVA
ncbi:Uncharacterised protein [Mycobacteroides abscessus subsp. abscessus]|nr:Uncharacterised protein [Mycobacteroides abscessus subsp. abscessus]SKW91468.1 Uncharacterised protein [Mycobacteroides abscessus subsp. abscessus]